MKVLHVIPHISDEASGPSYSVPRLCESFAARGHEVHLSCLASREPPRGVSLHLHREWRVLRSLSVSTEFARSLRKERDTFDIVHNHSLWSMVNVVAGLTVPGRKTRFITSPRGTLSLDALRRRKDAKRMLWQLQRPAVERAHLLHATSRKEYGDIRLKTATVPVAVIPNGIDLPPWTTRRGPEAGRTVLFLGRIHPMKGLDGLLEAWSRVESEHPTWRLVVVGKGEEAEERRIRDSARRLRLLRVEFPGPLYGEAKSDAYRAADLFILPSRSENFGVAVAEALAHGCPAIVSRGAPWDGLETHRCGWWVERTPEQLCDALQRAMRAPKEELRAMGARGREWMRREFSWETVSERMEEAYTWLLNGGPPPASVTLD